MNIKKQIPGIEIILDTGFSSHENLILLKDDSYIIAALIVLKTVKIVFSSASRTMVHVNNAVMYQNEPIFCGST